MFGKFSGKLDCIWNYREYLNFLVLIQFLGNLQGSWKIQFRF